MRALLVLVVLAGDAWGGRALYGWLPPTEIAADGSVALESAVYERDDLGPTHERASVLVLAPAIAVSDRLELALPVELASITATDMASDGLAFTKFGLEARYRFAPRAARWTPLARFAAIRDVVVRTELRGEAELGVALRTGRLHAEAAAGLVTELNLGGIHDQALLGLGASYEVRERLRLGGELHADLALDPATTSWAALGPNLAWTRGRFWLAGALAIGIHAIHAAPRVAWGMTW